MVQVHTLYRSSTWCTTVDGLQQACTTTSREAVVAQGRRTAAELGGRLYVHDVDGRVVEAEDFSGRGHQVGAEPVYYLG